MIAAIYSRKSKLSDKGESIENQLDLCKKYAESIGISEYIIYDKDEGFSGGNTNRPDFQRMIKDAKKKKFDVLICYRLDRISRNVLDFSSTIELLSEYGIDFVSIREKFDTTTPMGRAMMYISSVFAQLERETIAERIKDNMYELSKTGRWLGGTTPLGFESKPMYYKNGAQKDKKMMFLSPIAEEINLVKNIYDLYLEKGTLNKLQTYLIKKDVKTKSGVEWDIKYLQTILRNPVYVKSNYEVMNYIKSIGATQIYGEPNGNGILTYNKKTATNTYKKIEDWVFAVSLHPGVIDSNIWLKVQKQLDENKSRAPRLVSGGYGLLNGILKCAHCGASMYQKMGHTSIQTGETLRYYVCSTKTKSKSKTCKCKNIRLDEIESKVIDELYKRTSDKDAIYKDAIEYKQQLSSVDPTSDIKRIDSEISQKKIQINNLVTELSLDRSMKKYIKPNIEKLDKEIEVLSSQKETLINSKTINDETIKAIDLYTSLLIDFKSLYENADYDQKKYLLKSLISSIDYDSIKYEISINLFNSIKKKSLFDVESIQRRNRRLCCFV